MTKQTTYYATYCAILALLAFGLAAIGCKDKDAGTRRTSADKSEKNLQSIPYVGSSEIGENEGSGVVLNNPERSCPGYNLYSIQMLSKAELIDEAGKLIKEWHHSPSQRWENCELLPNGDLLVVGAEDFDWPDKRPFPRIADEARYVLRFNWKGDLLWKRKLLCHHDIEVTPGGNLLMLGFKRTFVPRIHHKIETRDDQLMMLNQEGKVIGSHSILDAVESKPDLFPLNLVKPNSLCGKPWVDLFHANSIEWIRHENLVGKHSIYEPGNILVCFRHQNRIAVFNWAKNEVVWSWGHDELDGPHDAQVLPNGHILLFDNGLERGYSRGLEMDPTTGKIVWQYKTNPPASFYTASKGSIQRLPNGNTLLAESDKGRAVEITPKGKIVWEFFCPEEIEKNKRAAIVRMKRYPRAFVASIIDTHPESVSGATVSAEGKTTDRATR